MEFISQICTKFSIEKIKFQHQQNKIINYRRSQEISLKFPCLGNKGDQFTRSLIRKLNRFFKEKVEFMKRYINFDQKLTLIIELYAQVTSRNTLTKPIETLLQEWINQTR